MSVHDRWAVSCSVRDCPEESDFVCKFRRIANLDSVIPSVTFVLCHKHYISIAETLDIDREKIKLD